MTTYFDVALKHYKNIGFPRLRLFLFAWVAKGSCWLCTEHLSLFSLLGNILFYVPPPKKPPTLGTLSTFKYMCACPLRLKKSCHHVAFQ